MKPKALPFLAIIVVSTLAISLPSTSGRAEDMVEKCNKLLGNLRTKVKDGKLTGASLAKAEGYLAKMDSSCKNKKFTEAGAAGLDILIEIDAAKK